MKTMSSQHTTKVQTLKIGAYRRREPPKLPSISGLVQLMHAQLYYIWGWNHRLPAGLLIDQNVRPDISKSRTKLTAKPLWNFPVVPSFPNQNKFGIQRVLMNDIQLGLMSLPEYPQSQMDTPLQSYNVCPEKTFECVTGLLLNG